MIINSETLENHEFLLKRFGFFNPEIIIFAEKNAKIGEVIAELDTFKREKPDYSLNRIFQSFNNS